MRHDRLHFSLFGFWGRAEPGSLLRQHEGGRPAHVPAALRHRLRAEGPVAGRALLVLRDDHGQAAVADDTPKISLTNQLGRFMRIWISCGIWILLHICSPWCREPLFSII